MEAQQKRSRAGSKDMFTQDVDRSKYLEGVSETKFIGYENLRSEDIKLLKDFEVYPAGDDSGVGGQRILIFDKSPFYAESGGQTGDSGTLMLE